MNISGRGNLANGRSEKWNAVHQMVREKKIGILALQETHLDEEAIETIHRLYGRQLKVIASPATNTTAAQGVAFVLNRELVDISEVTTQELVAGRALYIRTRWHGNAYLTAVNVYAPNAARDNAEFWPTVSREIEHRNLDKPSVILGDFNVVEEAIDRLPPHKNEPGQVEALRQLTRQLGLADGWRITEPTTVDYTFPTRGSSTCSHIDRIYVNDEILAHSAQWKLETTGVPTDHKMSTAELSIARAPFIGKGRWVLPNILLSDRPFMEQVSKMGEEAVRAATATASRDVRTVEKNPQTILRDLKATIRSTAQKRLKTKIPKMTAEIRKLEKSIAEIQRQPDFATNLAAALEMSRLQEKLRDLERRR
ncbi:hypothetical protein FOMPIDRAFT_1128754 [Fomitopsis schrenkii]|uniref:Endonuclease/exonuclease/phosphatase domain-containing protein n=1 Tax=Fomitopsis schrenkii TaxID=2126942 RepID=S8E1M5_FOMSC|nr:hypothetical protein FOMPIDRAFT_1128754 [Fomitopsis schrenkii]